MKASGALLERQAQPTALGLGQTGGKTGDLGDLPPPGQKRHRDQGQYRPDRIVGVLLARIGRFPKDLQQRFDLLGVDRQRARGPRAQTGAALLG